MDAKRLRDTTRLPVSLRATEGNTSLCLSRMAGQHLVLRLGGNEYMLVTVVREPITDRWGCMMRWNPESQVDYRGKTQVTRTGLQLVLSSVVCIELVLRQSDHLTNSGLPQASVNILAPQFIGVDRWEVLVLEDPKLASYIVRHWPKLFPWITNRSRTR